MENNLHRSHSARQSRNKKIAKILFVFFLFGTDPISAQQLYIPTDKFQEKLRCREAALKFVEQKSIANETNVRDVSVETNFNFNEKNCYVVVSLLFDNNHFLNWQKSLYEISSGKLLAQINEANKPHRYLQGTIDPYIKTPLNRTNPESVQKFFDQKMRD